MIVRLLTFAAGLAAGITIGTIAGLYAVYRGEPAPLEDDDGAPCMTLFRGDGGGTWRCGRDVGHQGRHGWPEGDVWERVDG
jgi:hypothetical protein